VIHLTGTPFHAGIYLVAAASACLLQDYPPISRPIQLLCLCRLLIDGDHFINNGNWMWLSCSAFFNQYYR
jgi:FAD binding domain of DNA photolyase